MNGRNAKMQAQPGSLPLPGENRRVTSPCSSNVNIQFDVRFEYWPCYTSYSNHIHYTVLLDMQVPVLPQEMESPFFMTTQPSFEL